MRENGWWSPGRASSTGKRSTLIIVSAFVALTFISSGLPAGMAQTSAASLRIDDLWAETPVIAGQGNLVQGTVRNDGSVPVSARITMVADGTQIYAATHFLGPGEPETVQRVWDASGIAAGKQTVMVSISAVVQIDDGSEVSSTREQTSIQRPVAWYDLALTPDAARPFAAGMEAGETATAGLIVTNHGSGADTAVLALTGATAGWTFDVSPTEVALAVDGSADVTVSARAPDDAQPTEEGAVTLAVRSAAERVTRVLDAFAVESPQVVEGTEVRLTVEPPIRTLASGANATYVVSVVNPTASTHDVSVAIAPTGSVDDIALDPTGDGVLGGGDLAPGDRMDFTVTADVAPEALAGLRAWDVLLDDESAATLQVDVAQEFAVDAHVDEAAVVPTAEPGAEYSLPVQISNLGNGGDLVCLSIETSPDGWDDAEPCLFLTPQVAGESEPDSLWNNTQAFAWGIDVVTSAPAGQHTLEFRAVSSGDEDVLGASRAVTVTVLERTHPVLVPPMGDAKPLLSGPPSPAGGEAADGPDLSIGAADCVFAVAPDDERSIPLVLRNDGNVDGEFLVETVVTDDAPPSGWTITDPSGTRAVAAGDDTTVQLVVDAPDLMEPEDFVTFEVRMVDADDSGRSDVRTCTVEAAFPDITILAAEPATAPADLTVDHPAVLLFHVANVGWAGTEDAVTVESRIEGPDGFELVQEHTVAELEAYPGTWWRTLEVGFNATEPGEYEYTIHVDPDQEFSEPGAAVNVLEGVVELHDFGIQVTPPATREAIPEQSVAFEEVTDSAFTVRNDAAVPHTLVLNLTMDPPWAVFEEETVTLEPTQTHVVEASFTVPELPMTSGVNVTLRAANASHPTMLREATVHVAIDDEEPPVIREFSANVTHILHGGSVDFTVEITDGAGVAAARLYLIAPDGDVRFVPMQADGPVGVFSASATFDALGNHSAHVWARDGAVSQNAADNQDDAISIEVLPSDRPHVRLVTPDNESYVRPGSPIVLTILSKHPIVQVSYSLDGNASVALAPANPLHVPTDEWPEGPAAVRVVARDAVGATADGQFAFLLDGTPPRVVNLSVDAPGGATGVLAHVAAEIEDETGVASAVVRVARADGTAEESALTPAEGSSWTANVEIPVDVASATVVATDLAGNRGFGERTFAAAPQDAGESSGFAAAPGVVAALAAVAAAVLLGARRPRSR